MIIAAFSCETHVMSSSSASPVHSEVQPSVCEQPVRGDCRALRSAFAQFATGVTVITAQDADGPFGLTVNSFASVSLDPPLVLWSLSNTATDFERFCRVGHYCVNVLAVDQSDLSNRFASRVGDRFDGVEWLPGIGGAPVLAGCCASFEVNNEVRHPGGDHYIFVGRVERFSEHAGRTPLVFQGGSYRRLDGG